MIRRVLPILSKNLIFTLEDVATARRDPEGYWSKKAANIDFFTPFQRVVPNEYLNSNHRAASGVPLTTGQWFEGGTLNIAYNCLDRHIAAGLGEKIAFHYESPVTGSTQRHYTYNDVYSRVCGTAEILRDEFGVRCGDRVIIYMPNTMEAVFSMLACARIGAPHSVVFGGFAIPELSKRILDSGAKVVLTTNFGVEAHRVINYKHIVDSAIQHLPNPAQVEKVGVWMRTESLFSANSENGLSASLAPLRDALKSQTTPMVEGRDFNCTLGLDTLLSRTNGKIVSFAQPVSSNHPFYMLYTSGTTGMPKGIVRETAGMAVMLAHSIRHIYGIDRHETFFTASDIGWIVGTNFSVYAPLLIGATSVLYEGKPVGTPNPGAFFRILQDYHVAALFTAPTAIRAIKAQDPDGEWMKKYKLDHMHAVFLAGERTDPDTHHWLAKLLNVPIIDNWWQTETGSPITSSPRRKTTTTNGGTVVTDEIWTKPGSAGVSCPGWMLDVVPSSDIEPAMALDAGMSKTTTGIPTPSSNPSSVDMPKQDLDCAAVSTTTTTDRLQGEIIAHLPLPPGALSNIWGRPTAIRDVYFAKKKKKTNISTTPSPEGQIFFSTFDAGCIDEDGFVHVMTRTDDIINTAGHRLSTGYMEEILSSHPAVAEAAVFGQLCPLKGEKPVALVVIKQGRHVEVKELEKHVKSTLGPVSAITVFRVSKLPKTRSGKVLRKTLRHIANKKHMIDVPPTIEDESVLAHIWEVLHGNEIPYPHAAAEHKVK